MKLLLLNGPPKCGKDTVVRELVPYIKFRHMKFSMPMKRALAGLLDISEADVENFKDVRSSVLQRAGTETKENRDTLRDFLIDFFDNYLAKRYGEDILGRMFWQHAKNSPEQLIVASDCGKLAEVERVVSNAGRRNCVLVRIHRNGTTFDGDNRSYMPDNLCDTWDINNNGTLHLFTMKVLRVISREMGLTLLKDPDWTKELA